MYQIALGVTQTLKYVLFFLAILNVQKTFTKLLFMCAFTFFCWRVMIIIELTFRIVKTIKCWLVPTRSYYVIFITKFSFMCTSTYYIWLLFVKFKFAPMTLNTITLLESKIFANTDFWMVGTTTANTTVFFRLTPCKVFVIILLVKTNFSTNIFETCASVSLNVWSPTWSIMALKLGAYAFWYGLLCCNVWNMEK